MTGLLQIGFIGLGSVSLSMVNNILSNTGNEVIACDSSSQALSAAEKLGAETTSSPAALAESEGNSGLAHSKKLNSSRDLSQLLRNKRVRG